MTRMQLSLDTLKDFDLGKPAVAFEQAMAEAVRNCLDRPGEKKARNVELTVNIKPVLQQDGDVVDVEVDFTIKTKLPPWQTATRPVKPTKRGQLFFNDLASDDPDQHTIDEQIERNKRPR